MITFITFVLVLSLLVFVHELGHFWTARKFGVKAEEFGFGLPPRFFGVYKDKNGRWKKVFGSKQVEDAGDTVYSFNWLPLGGFVKIKGEDGEGANEIDSFAHQNIGKRAIILLAGVTMNILLAGFLLSFGYMIGLPQAIDKNDERAEVLNRQIQIMQVIKDSPAEKAEIKTGDTILSIDEIIFSKYDDLQKYVDQNTGKGIIYKIKRGEKELEIPIIPEYRQETGRGGIGVVITETGLVKYSFFWSFVNGFQYAFIMLWVILVAFYDLLKGLIMGEGVGADIAGPVGIAVLTGQVARMGLVYIMQFTAVLSVNLAIINALPFPALDGGRVLFLIIEKIKGSPVNKDLENTIHYIGFALLMLLIVVVTYKDVIKHGSGLLSKFF